MAIASLPLGQLSSMLQNIAYACSPRLLYLFCSDAGATFQACNEPTFASPVSLTPYEGYVFMTGAFVRCTSGNVTVIPKAN